jgi:hypothetical protein
MRCRPHFGLKLGKVFWTAGLVFFIALSGDAREQSANISRAPAQVRLKTNVSEPASSAAATESQVSGDRREVMRFAMDFDGDHSLDLATVIEQEIGAYSRYTVHLHLASGVEQSIAVTAPPGGLRLEMKDMTGDKVRNDLILRPALMRWLPTVLVNDGHDHFAIVISNRLSDSLSCGQDLESGGNNARAGAALMSSGFKARGFTSSREFLPQLREIAIVSSAETIVPRWDLTINSGRAPPAPVTSL